MIVHALRYVTGESMLQEETNDFIENSLFTQDDLQNIIKSDDEPELDENGNPINTPPANPPANPPAKTDIVELEENDVISIEDEQGNPIELIIDKDGNATKDGKIVYTKEQLKTLTEEENTDIENTEDLHSKIANLSGIELKDEKGNIIKFSDGLEGLAEREKKVAETYLIAGKNTALNEFFKKNPDLKSIYDYKLRTGTIDNFSSYSDYSTLKITDETPVDVLKDIYKKYLSSIGNDKDTIEKLINLSVNEETLRADSLSALGKLQEKQKQENEDLLAKQEERKQEAIKKYENYYGVKVNEKNEIVDANIKDSLYDKIVKQGKIGNIVLPTTGLIVSNEDGSKKNISRNDIFNYFYKVAGKDDDGNYYTQAQIDERTRMDNTDNFIIQGIKNLTKNDLKSLEKAMKDVINLGNAKKLIKVIKSSTQTQVSAQDIQKQIKDGKGRIILNED